MPFRSATGSLAPEDVAGRGPARQPQRQRARQRRSRRPRIKTVYLVAAATVIVTAAVAVTLSQHSGVSNTPPQVSPQQRAAARYDALAVSWVVSQVGRTTTVSCDQKVCAALVKAGFPQDDVQVLGASSGTPLTSEVIVETPDIRQIFGTRLTTQFAPTVLTVEGSGPQDVVIGAVAPDGPAAYQTALKADMRASKAASATLLAPNSGITFEPSARRELAAGMVDARLIVAITAVAGAPLPVTVIDFANFANDDNSDVPLRYADIADPPRGSHLSAAAYALAVSKALNLLPASERPIRPIPVDLPGGVTALQIVFPAPSPFDIPGF